MASLRLRVQPGAKRSEVVGWSDDTLRVRVTAPPVEGRANEAIILFLAKLLDVPKSRISIKSGHSGRDKVVAVDGLSSEDLLSRLPPHP
jgi:uncharacterized protein